MFSRDIVQWTLQIQSLGRRGGGGGGGGGLALLIQSEEKYELKWLKDLM